MIGKGDVGKVYLVREKKTGKLFAMKGSDSEPLPKLGSCSRRLCSALQEGDDRTQKD